MKSDLELYRELIQGIKGDRPQVLIRRFNRSGMASEMVKQLVDPAAISETETDEGLVLARESYLTGRPVLKGGTESGGYLFAEPFFPPERLIILGGGHVAVPLAEFAARCGFKITLVDDRPVFANQARFPMADEVVCDSFENYLKALTITASDYIVLVTRGHRYDLACLREIFKKDPPRYLGMIGSKKRVAVIKNKLLQEGVEALRLDEMCSPIGLKIGAQTPEEIGISIVAELIWRKRLDLRDQPRINRSDLDVDVILNLPKTGEQRSLVTILSSTGSVPRSAGACMTVTRDRRITGSIGGGCSESEIAAGAAENTGTGRYYTALVDLSGAAAEEEGMVCGGRMTVLVEDLLL